MLQWLVERRFGSVLEVGFDRSGTLSLCRPEVQNGTQHPTIVAALSPELYFGLSHEGPVHMRQAN